MCDCFFFFKQKSAYVMRISDWSSDVCSSDLVVEVMRSNLQAQTATCVMNSFGISVNTWTKLRDGKPIRRSVAERLIGRLGRVGGYLPERQYADRGVAGFNRDPVGSFERSEEHTSELQSLMRITTAVFFL